VFTRSKIVYDRRESVVLVCTRRRRDSHRIGGKNITLYRVGWIRCGRAIGHVEKTQYLSKRQQKHGRFGSQREFWNFFSSFFCDRCTMLDILFVLTVVKINILCHSRRPFTLFFFFKISFADGTLIYIFFCQSICQNKMILVTEKRFECTHVSKTE